jgi:hypothetical protein
MTVIIKSELMCTKAKYNLLKQAPSAVYELPVVFC